MPNVRRFSVIFLWLALLVAMTPATQAALPNPLASSTKEEPISDAQLEKSLDQIIRTLENDQQRSDLLQRLKQLRDVTQKSKAENETGVSGFIGQTIDTLGKQFTGDNNPWSLWSRQYELAKAELNERIPPIKQWPVIVFEFLMILTVWGLLALGLLWSSRRIQQRFGLAEQLPQHPKTTDLMLFAVRKLGPWLVAFFMTLYLSFVLPHSLSKGLAMAMAYSLLCGTLFSALSVIALSLLSGPHRQRALDILRRQAFRPLWLIGTLATLGEVAHDPRLVSGLGEHLALFISNFANICAALLTALFVVRFRKPITHLISNQSLARRKKRRGLHDLLALLGSFWYVPVLLLVAISLLATFISAGDSTYALRRALLCAVLAVLAMTVNGLLQRLADKSRGDKRSPIYIEQLKKFGFTLLHIVSLLAFIELGLRVWGLSLIRYAQGDGHDVMLSVFSFAGTLVVAWLIWILCDTAIQHSLGVGNRGRNNTRALTMLPLIRNVLFITISVIALIVALANMGMNVTPLLAGAGVIGLAIGFGAQSLVADLINGLFIIIEDSLSIDDYVDVAGHLGTVEGLTIRTVRLRDLDGIVHIIPFSEIKSIMNYSRQFGYAMFRWPVPASMTIDDAIAMIREVAGELRSDRTISSHIWSGLELQGVESFDSGQAILRFRFKTAPIKQWEVQRAFNLLLRRKLDQAGIQLAMPRLNVQLTPPPRVPTDDEMYDLPADGGI